MFKKFQNSLDKYCLDHDCIDSSYHRAYGLFRELIDISYNDQEFYNELLLWIDMGSTVRLTNLLLKTTYYCNNINDFNAFTTLDTVNLSGA